MKSLVWDNTDQPITQNFGVYNNNGMYDYAAYYGYPAGTHIGIDIGMDKGTEIFAAEPGEVTQAGFSNSFRPMPVIIKEQDGDEAIYGHLWTNDVKVGDKVKAGQKLGTSGEQTKLGTWNPDGSGPHLHFELRRDGKAIDPIPELTGASGETFGSSGTEGISKIILGVGGIAILGLVVLLVVK